MHKRSKGRVCGKSLSTALALLFFAAIAAPAGAGELYGLVVGIDDYVGTANDLDGAANDANDIAKSLTGAGAKEVVRSAVERLLPQTRPLLRLCIGTTRQLLLAVRLL